MTPPNDTIARPAYFVGHSEDGQHLIFESVTTPVDDKRPTLIVVSPDRVVPIIFVPGIMGSNLKAAKDIETADKRKVIVKKDKPVWRVDNELSMLHWINKAPDEYQLRLRHEVVTVDDGGALSTKGLKSFEKGQTPMAVLTEEQARARGWGTVSAMFYLGFLSFLEHHLNAPSKDSTQASAPDNPALASLKQVHTSAHPLGAAQSAEVPPLSGADIDLLLQCHNPVHAFGYNWLQSNAVSGKALMEYIDSTIKAYVAKDKQCDKVILVTHSMGGLVARAACKLQGAEDLVAGVFHGVMPTDGAAASYKRMVSGFGGEGGELKGWAAIENWAMANILGPRGNFTTPTLALNAGPLELLPNKRYNGGKPWLMVKDAAGQALAALPQEGGDPYSEIYTEEKIWWKPCNEAWMNPAALDLPNPFEGYGKAVGLAGKFHSKLQAAGDFHPVTHAHYGQDGAQKAYGTVTWTLDKALTPEQHSGLQRHKLSDADMHITLKAGSGQPALKVQATLSAPDAPGDGTVPAQASAQAVDQGVKKTQGGGVLVRGTGYAHSDSFATTSLSEGPRAALHAVLLILKTPGVVT